MNYLDPESTTADGSTNTNLFHAAWTRMESTGKMRKFGRVRVKKNVVGMGDGIV